MSFAEQRQAALQAGALNSSLFAEDVQLEAGGQWRIVRAKLTLTAVNDAQGRLVGATGIFATGTTTDEEERLAVCVSRDAAREGPLASIDPAAAGGSLVRVPQIGDRLLRSESRDPDRRPFVFKGEIMFAGDQHAVYTFVRPRRFSQGRRS